MGKINLGRVVLGGIVAGVIIDVFENVLNGVVLAGQWNSVMASLNRTPVGMNGIILFNLIGLVMGILAVWSYAAMRPRFGVGAATALIAAIFFWFVGYLLPDVELAIMGLVPTSMTTITIAVGLIEIVVATEAGAWLYREGESIRQVAPA